MGGDCKFSNVKTSWLEVLLWCVIEVSDKIASNLGVYSIMSMLLSNQPSEELGNFIDKSVYIVNMEINT